jgi:hypothetical protein
MLPAASAVAICGVAGEDSADGVVLEAVSGLAPEPWELVKVIQTLNRLFDIVSSEQYHAMCA